MQQHLPETKNSSNTRFYIHAFILLSLLGVAAFFVLAMIRPSSQMGVFFYNRHDVFMDFYNTVYYSVDRTPYTWGNLSNHNYLPLNYLLFYPLTLLNPAYDIYDMGTSYAARNNQFLAISCFLFMFVSLALFLYLLSVKMNFDKKYKRWILPIFLFSAPILFCIDRANTIVLASALVLVFLVTYQSPQKGRCHIGYLCLAMAAALKIFPALFGVLLLKEKKYKDALITVLYGLAFAVLPFLLLKGNVVDNLLLFVTAIAEHAEAYAAGHFGFYPAFVGYLFLALAMVYVWLHKPCDWKTHLVLFLAYFMTSGQQGFYCIILIFYPLVLFLNETSHKKSEFIFLLCFVLLLTPFQYGFLFPATGLDNMVVSNLLLIVMYIWLLAEEVFVLLTKQKTRLA